jgi:ribose 5-phosphate isomerase B
MDARRGRIAVGSDMPHETADAVAQHLEEAGYDVVRCGAVEGPDTPWPAAAEQVARLVAQRAVDSGVVCCWTGTGVSIAANKVPGVRAALCGDAETARGARKWNAANVLAIGLMSTGPSGAAAIVDAWLETSEIDPVEADNIARVTELEQRYAGRPDATGQADSMGG